MDTIELIESRLVGKASGSEFCRFVFQFIELSVSEFLGKLQVQSLIVDSCFSNVFQLIELSVYEYLGFETSVVRSLGGFILVDSCFIVGRTKKEGSEGSRQQL